MYAGKGNLIYTAQANSHSISLTGAQENSFRLMAKDKKAGLHGSEYIEYVLTAPLEEVFDTGKPRVALPEKARSLRSVKCSICGEAAAETKMRVHDGKPVCIECFSSYDRGWKHL